MRAGVLSITLVLSAAPAFGDTLKEVTTRGVMMTVGDAKIDTAFTPDGRYLAAAVIDGGKWRIEGDRLCSVSDQTLVESCAVYPKDKKSGDTFTLQTAQGEVSITIK